MEAVITAPHLMIIVGVGIAYLLLALVTNVRAGLEEKMLEDRYSEYSDYRRRTKRYIRFVV
jgi:protein-S-isoprenylcysteine O-methyltransferase Ste14